MLRLGKRFDCTLGFKQLLGAGDDEGRITPLPYAIRARWEHPVGLAVAGSRHLSLTLGHP